MLEISGIYAALTLSGFPASVPMEMYLADTADDQDECSSAIIDNPDAWQTAFREVV